MRTAIAIIEHDDMAAREFRRLIAKRLPNVAVERYRGNERNLIADITNAQRYALIVLTAALDDYEPHCLCRQLRRSSRDIPILALTAFPIGRFRDSLAHAGAQGIASKNDADAVANLIVSLCTGNIPDGFDTPAAAYTRLAASADPTTLLTAQELKVFYRAYVLRLGTAQIAAELGVSPATVRKHLSNGRKQFGPMPEEEIRTALAHTIKATSLSAMQEIV